MIKELVHDPIFLGQRSETATIMDLQTAKDLLDTLTAHKDTCVGMAANMIGVKKRIICFDNEGTFNNKNVKKAVIRLCSDFNIPIDTIPKLNVSITHIYIDKCVSDILEKCGGGYNFDMTPNGIRIYTYGVLQDVIKIDEKDGYAKACAKNKLSELNKVKESFSIEIIEAVNSYTRAGSMITVDDVNYLIESSDHSIKNGVHYVKLGLRKFR